MILEKDKVYKIEHTREPYHPRNWRNYIVCSPKVDVNTENFTTAFKTPKRERYTQFDCHFVVCFDGNINISGNDCRSGFLESCKVIPLNDKDLEEIKEAVTKLGAKYNRKLNKVIL